MIDYCSFGNHSCQHECVSIPNGHYCRCRSGFTLQPDSRSCRGTSRHGGVAQTEVYGTYFVLPGLQGKGCSWATLPGWG